MSVIAAVKNVGGVLWFAVLFHGILNLLLTNVPFQRLAEWVAIKSVSAEPEKRSEVVRMVKFVGAEIERLGGRVEYVDVGMQKVRKLLSCLSVCLVSSTLTVPLSHLDHLP